MRLLTKKGSRRLFLTGAGGAMLALPWLPSLLPRAVRRTAEAQEDGPPTRFIAVKTYNGAPVLDWYPRQAPQGYTTHGHDGTVVAPRRLAEATGRHSNGSQYTGHWAPLSDFADTGISNVFGTGFNRYHDQMLLLRGLGFHARDEPQLRGLSRQLRAQHQRYGRPRPGRADQRDHRLRDGPIRRGVSDRAGGPPHPPRREPTQHLVLRADEPERRPRHGAREHPAGAGPR